MLCSSYAERPHSNDYFYGLVCHWHPQIHSVQLGCDQDVLCSRSHHLKHVMSIIGILIECFTSRRHHSPSRSAFFRFIQKQARIVASNNNDPPPVPPAISGKYDLGVFTVVSFSLLSGMGGGVDGSGNTKEKMNYQIAVNRQRHRILT